MTHLTAGWPSPILIGEIENKALVDDTVQYILETYDLEHPPGEIKDSNIFEDTYFDNFKKEIVEPAFDQWFKQVRNKSVYEFKDREYKAWITGVQNGYSMLSHNHNGSQLSSVFYLLNDNPEAGGEIIFYDPRSNANRSYKNEDWLDFFEPLRLKVPSYTFAVFPSFIFHQVTTFEGHMRLAVPVDLFI